MTNKTSTHEQIQRDYDQKGYVVLKDIIDTNKLSELRETIRALFRMHGEDGEDIFETTARLDSENQPLLYRINNTIDRTTSLSSLLHDLIWIPRLLTKERWPLVALTQSVLFGLPKDKRLTYGWHQESAYWPTLAPIFNYWFPIFEAGTKSNGAMSLLESSHNLGNLPYVKLKESANSYTNLIPENIEGIQLKHSEYWCEINMGDLVVFHEDMLHRSNFNHSENTRFSGVMRVCAIRNQVPERLEGFEEIY